MLTKMRSLRHRCARNHSTVRRDENLRPSRQLLRLDVETLEFRAMLSSISLLDTTTASSMISSAEITTAAVTNSTVTGLTPAQVLQAYGFNQISFSGVKGDGTGQTIAIVDAYNDPNIASDLAVFSQKFGLAAANLTVHKMSSNIKTDSGWAMEIALDVEWAHAIAPGATILLVEASSSSLTDLLAAVDYARNQADVSVISMSWGSTEFVNESTYDSYFTTPAGHQPITFVASSGDSGAPASWPSVSPNVMAVGGTTLSVSSSGTYLSETAWSSSGGGASKYESEPSYQTSVQSTSKRTSPDVAYDANTSTGFAVYNTVASSGQTGWFRVGGTSAGAPQWAALVAIADQGRKLSGKSTLGNAQAAIYTLSSSDFHDVTSGSNGYSATTGYDLVTGRGTPIANKVVADLVAFSGSTSFTLSSSSSSSGSTTTTHFPTRGRWFPGYSSGYRPFADTGDTGEFTDTMGTQSTPGGATFGGLSAWGSPSGWAAALTMNRLTGDAASSPDSGETAINPSAVAARVSQTKIELATRVGDPLPPDGDTEATTAAPSPDDETEQIARRASEFAPARFFASAPMEGNSAPMAGFAASASVVSAQPVQGESLAANRQGALAVDRLFGRDEEDAGDEAAESLFQSAWFDDYFGERSPDNLSRHSFDALALTIAVAVMRQAQPAEPERNRPGHPALRS